MGNNKKNELRTRRQKLFFFTRRKFTAFIAVSLILLGILLISCLKCSNTKLKMKIGDEYFHVEVVDTAEAMRKGLSGRNTIDKDSGMLFVFPNDRRLAFWMKDTQFPLSLAYLSRDGRIKELYNMKAMSEEEVQSRGIYRYALELPLGAFQNAKARVGTKIEIVDSDKRQLHLLQ